MTRTYSARDWKQKWLQFMEGRSLIKTTIFSYTRKEKWGGGGGG